MRHRCCFWLDLRRGTVAIGAFYVFYLLLWTLALTVLAAVYSDGRLALSVGGTLLLLALAGGLLLGAVRRHRPLLLLWLLAYGAVLLTLTVGLLALIIAGDTGHKTFVTEFCASRPTGRCPFRMFRYFFILFAVEWYFWTVVLLRYREMGREALADPAEPQPPGVMVRGAHDGGMQHVPVTYCDDSGLLRGAATTEVPGYGYGPTAAPTDPMAPANQARHLIVMRGC